MSRFLLPRTLALLLTVSLTLPGPAYGLRPEGPGDRPEVSRQLHAGLEERAAKAVGIVEGAVKMGIDEAGPEGKQAVVVDGSALSDPKVRAVAIRMARSETLKNRVAIWEEYLADPPVPSLFSIRAPDDLVDFVKKAKSEGVSQVLFLGPEARVQLVQTLVLQAQLDFTAAAPSLVTLLAGFLPGPLAADLAAGMEEIQALGGQA